MTAFDRALDWERTEDRTYRGSIDDSWVQGRGVFGGMVLALFERGFARSHGHGSARPLRSITCSFCAPMLNDVCTLRIRVLREGGSVSFLDGTLHGDGEIIAHASAVYAAPRRLPVSWVEVPPPEVQPPAAIPELPADLPGLPAFSRHVEYRYGLGGIPFTGGETALTGGWSRLREERFVDVPWVLATLDAWPPPGFVRLDRPAAAATLCISCELSPRVADLPAEGHRHTLFASESAFAADGYCHEKAHLWSESGELLARATQVRAILRR